jgi:hypothetical protein
MAQTSMDVIDEHDFDEFGPAVIQKKDLNETLGASLKNQSAEKYCSIAQQQISLSTKKKQEAFCQLQNDSLTFSKPPEVL